MVMFFKRFIQVNGYRITFETKILTDLDFRKYKIIVENNYGEGVEFKPGRFTICSILDVFVLDTKPRTIYIKIINTTVNRQ
jgi:hypothetical protein